MPERPAIPPGPVITLVYRVAPARRRELFDFLQANFPVYERPGGIRMGLYEHVDEPDLLLELVAYATEEAYQRDQVRVAEDPEMKRILGDWHALLDGPVEFRAFRPATS